MNLSYMQTLRKVQKLTQWPSNRCDLSFLTTRIICNSLIMVAAVAASLEYRVFAKY
jgi:hypothetical protein